MSLDAYAVLGNPIAHSQSPWIHQRFAQLCGQDLRYTAHLVPLGGLSLALRTLQEQGLRGCNVTVPFKHEAFALAQQRSPEAVLAQAANTLCLDSAGIRAENTDGIGLVQDLTHNAGFTLQGKDILLLGAGGAAAGVLAPLLEQAPRCVQIANRSVEKAQALCAKHQTHAQLLGVRLEALALETLQSTQYLGPPVHLLINATASSLQGAALHLSPALIEPQTLVYDMMYGALAQNFLMWAQTLGAQTRDGLGMLVEQAAQAFWLWRGVRPPSQMVLAELRGRLG